MYYETTSGVDHRPSVLSIPEGELLMPSCAQRSKVQQLSFSGDDAGLDHDSTNERCHPSNR